MSNAIFLHLSKFLFQEFFLKVLHILKISDIILFMCQETLVPQCDPGDTEMVCTWQGKNWDVAFRLTLQRQSYDARLIYVQQEATTGSSTLQLRPLTWEKLMKRGVPPNRLRTAD